jgi:hypothetical protein
MWTYKLTWHNKPSLNVYWRKMYGQSNAMAPGLFPSFPLYQQLEFGQFRLRAGKNDPFNPFIPDEFVRRGFASTGHPASIGALTGLWVNGMLKGYYNLVNKVDDEFLNSFFSDDEDWTVVKTNQLESGSYDLLYEWFNTANVSVLNSRFSFC